MKSKVISIRVPEDLGKQYNLLSESQKSIFKEKANELLSIFIKKYLAVNSEKDGVNSGVYSVNSNAVNREKDGVNSGVYSVNSSRTNRFPAEFDLQSKIKKSGIMRRLKK